VTQKVWASTKLAALTEEITAISERRLVGRRRLGKVSPAEAEMIREMVHRMIV